MGDHRFRTCRGCGKSHAEVGELSWTRLCLGCGIERVSYNLTGLMSHSGPAFERWRQGMAASVGGSLLDGGAAEAHTSERVA